MEDIYFKNLKILDKFVIRAPMNEFNSMEELSEEFIVDFWKKTPLFRESVYLASPLVYNQMEKYLQTNNNIPENKKNRIIYTIVKYYKRFTTRSTPFGMFSALDVLHIGDSNNSRVDLNSFERVTRLDNHFISILIQKIQSSKLYSKKLLYKLNSSLYELKDSYRYIEFEINNKQKKYNISSLDKDIYLEKIVEISKEYNSIENLINKLISEEINDEEAEEFIIDLIDNQVLISDLEPSVVGGDPLSQLIFKLKNYGEDVFNPIINTLEKIKLELLNLDINKINQISVYENIIDIFNKLNLNFDDKNLFQVDCKLHILDNSLGKDYVNNLLQLKKGFNLLEKITIQNKNPLEKFISDYQKRYDTTIQPLSKVLDSDIGIELNLLNEEDVEDNNKSTIENILFNKYLETIKNNELAINISDDDFKIIQIDNKPFPSSFSTNAIYSIVNLEDKDYIYFKGFGGNSAIDLFGRFTHLSKEILDLVFNIRDHEVSLAGDQILADIIFLPEARIGNILTREKIFDYHIQYLGNSNLEKENLININDLFIEIKNNKVLLRSKKHKKYIIPRLSNAHNYIISSIPIYKFLCLTQSQFSKSLYPSYGYLNKILKFQPRIVYENIILRAATWNFTNEEFKKVIDFFKKDDISSLLLELSLLVKANNLPDKLLLSEGDNELFINLNNTLSIKTFINEIVNKKNFILKEFFIPGSLVKKGNKVFINEIIHPFLNTEGLEPDSSLKQYQIKESYVVDEEWLFYKIYGGEHILEKLLLDFFDVFNEKNNLFQKWFFIRFYDSNGYHLRIRFLSSNKNDRILLNSIVQEYFSAYLKDELISNFSIDTYRRELERYHRDTLSIDKTETFFYFDSQCIIKILKKDNFILEDRMFISIMNIDSILSSFDYSMLEKYNLVKNLREVFFIEFGQNKTFNQSLRKKFKEIKHIIKDILPYERDNKTEFNNQLDEIFIERDILLKKYIKTDKQTINTLISSYLHMSIDRLFFNNNRWYEFCSYDALEKYYSGLIIRMELKIKNK
ncbi:hypothetical protein AS589_08055 [Empedobacter brevis]|uniref:lantibiotic dehydratase n=1 Tax=Empedobacter brevis TaxID=247 RepID=UPI00131FEB45|nr:lantibiotic dehydratase [Empedobacter brevis]QHC84740.1 hypothetical protein AS589_08055 [Empedobacter brevis]